MRFKKIASLVLLLQLLLISFPLPLSAYPAYTANSDLVIAGPYDTAVSGAANWGITAGQGNTSRDFITIGQKYRVRQNGSISRIRLYTTAVGDLTGFYLKAWRKDGSAYDLVGTSNNLVASLVSGNYSTIDLTTPIAVQEGDYIGYRMENTGNGGYYFYARTSITGVASYLVTNATPSENDYNWVGQTSISGAVLPIEIYMTSPQVAFIGDSIIAGHPAHYSFLEATATTSIDSTIEKQFGNLTGYTYQNMGIGSQTTANISSRFTADIINLKPKIVVIEGGVNDIAGSVAKSTFIANWTSMLDVAQASSYITSIIVLKILPWSNGTTAQMQTRDDWNASLATLAGSYSKAIVVDASSYVGQFRAGGDEGNLWDIQTAYNSGGVHFNQAGHTQIAEALADSLPKTSVTFDNDFLNWNAGSVTANYNLIQIGGSTGTNISQTASSGIEYSTDGSAWSDATKGTGGDALTGLTSSASPGTDHSFFWDSLTDLPAVEDDAVYLRIRPNDGTTSAVDWILSNAFGIDNVAPSSVGTPTFGTITNSSIEIIKPETVSESGSGLYQWQARRNETTESGFNDVSVTPWADVDLLPNTQYAYDVKFKDNVNNVSSYGTQASKYTLASAPTNFSASLSSNSIFLTVDSFPNDTAGQSGYYFSRSDSKNSGWIQTNLWQDTGLSCGNSYTYSVKYRNNDAIETDSVSVVKSTSECAGQAPEMGRTNSYSPPQENQIPPESQPNPEPAPIIVPEPAPVAVAIVVPAPVLKPVAVSLPAKKPAKIIVEKPAENLVKVQTKTQEPNNKEIIKQEKNQSTKAAALSTNTGFFNYFKNFTGWLGQFFLKLFKK
jgi:lysophospholipase L1-like esterase